MNKYDKMVEDRKTCSREKVERALNAIQKLRENGEAVSVFRLVEITELSRGFFYKNAEVRKAFDQAVEAQSGIIDPRRKILDLAMDRKIDFLEQKIKKLELENEQLKEGNRRLSESLKRRNLNVLKGM